MNRATIFGLLLLSFGCIACGAQSTAQASAGTNLPGGQTQSNTPAPAAQTQPAPSPPVNQAAPAANQSPAAKKRHKKKPSTSNCPTTDAGAKTPDASRPQSANPTTAASNAPGGATTQPCPPPKKVVQNGGSSEPSIQLVGGETAQQTAQQRSIDELTAATAENLKKLEGRQLPQTQEDTVKQIKQFMEQSKTAVAAGDLERGNNLATKARLLSDELVKP